MGWGGLQLEFPVADPDYFRILNKQDFFECHGGAGLGVGGRTLRMVMGRSLGDVRSWLDAQVRGGFLFLWGDCSATSLENASSDVSNSEAKKHERYLD